MVTHVDMTTVNSMRLPPACNPNLNC